MASPAARMKHPRWRWIFAAGQLGQRVPNDGLGTSFAADQSIKQLTKAYQGKSKIRSQNKAIDLYHSETTRVLLDAMLLATDSVTEAAHLLQMSSESVQWYSDWFFDITVFEDPVDKALYLDKLAQREPQEASILRNALGMSKDSLSYILRDETSEKMSAAKFLTRGLEVTANLAFAFVPKELEAALDAGDLDKYKERLQLFQTFYGMALKTVDVMLKGELDKTKEEFLTNFVMKLKDVTPEAVIRTEKPPELL